MVGATAACLHRVFGTQTMVQATAACLHRVVWHQNHGEGNGRLPSPCVFGGGLGAEGLEGLEGLGMAYRYRTEPKRRNTGNTQSAKYRIIDRTARLQPCLWCRVGVGPEFLI